MMPTKNLLQTAIATQWRVIVALILRETHTRFGKTKLGYLWALFEGVMHILVFILIFTAMGRKSPLEGDLPFFFVSGLLPFLIYQKVSQQVMQAYVSNSALFSFPQVTPFNACISRYILELATATVVFLIFCLALTSIGSSVFFNDLLSFSIAFLSLSLFGLSTGIINANIQLFYPAYNNIYASSSRFLYFTSGIFFTADSLPKIAMDILYFNPLLHCIEWARSALYPHFESQTVNLEYVFWWIIILSFVALSTQRILFEKARVPNL